MIVEVNDKALGIDKVDWRYPTEENVKMARLKYSLETAISAGFISEEDLKHFEPYIIIVEE